MAIQSGNWAIGSERADNTIFSNCDNTGRWYQRSGSISTIGNIIDRDNSGWDVIDGISDSGRGSDRNWTTRLGVDSAISDFLTIMNKVEHLVLIPRNQGVIRPSVG